MGTATVSVQDGVPAAVTVSMSVPPPPTFNVDVDLPFGSVLGTVRTFLTLPGGTNTVALPQVMPPVNLPFQQSIPAIGGSAVGVVVVAPGTGGSASLAWVPGLAVPPEDASLTLTAAPDVLEPYDGATGVAPGVTFAVADGVDDAHTFVFRPVANGPEIAVSTMDGTIDLPDLGTYSALLAWPSGADYSWTVRTARPYLEASNLVTGQGDPEARVLRTFQGAVGYGPGPAFSGSATVTPSRTFTVE